MTGVFVTAGCGFLGRHLADSLLLMGHRVLIEEQDTPNRPDYLPAAAVLVPGLMEDPAVLTTVLAEVEVVVHLLCPDRPDPLTPRLLAAMAEAGTARLVLESTLEVYGEGLYADGAGRMLVPRRRAADLEAGRWEVTGQDGQPLLPLPTPESTAPDPTGRRGQVALAREAMVRDWASAPGRQIRILRMGALFGPPHESAHPLPGAIGRMMAEVAAGSPPSVAEDGGQIRDWLHVRDAARALRLAVEHQTTPTQILNIASGRGLRSDEVARLITTAAFRYDLDPRPLGVTETGAARHLVGLPDAAARDLGFTVEHPIENSLGELAMWVRDNAVEDTQAARLHKLATQGQLVGPGAATV